MMPDMDGHEVCRRLKENAHTSDIPVIFVTAQDSPEEEAYGLDVGAVDFISKPLNAPVVRARVRTHLTLKRQGDLLRSMALIDGLTGIANRRYFDEALAVEWRDCLRNDYPLSLILMDVDHFKLYNDHYGHQEGDTCLYAIARTIKASLGRAHDLAARYGGEEFVCILPHCTLEGAMQVADKIRSAVEALQIPHAASSSAPVVTISAGVGCVVPTDALRSVQLISHTDKQLYCAKETGRNRVAGTLLDAILAAR
jgi:diguanylate cyclase (GGDEF)-like protein